MGLARATVTAAPHGRMGVTKRTDTYGTSVRVVQEIWGWTSLRMLERYTHPTDAGKHRAVETASRLTRVGTKNGIAVPPCGRRRQREPRKLLPDQS